MARPRPRSLRYSPQYLLRSASTSSGLAITDLVQIYRAKVARGELDADENQLRAVYQLQKVQQRLMDYEPPPESQALLHKLTMPSRPSSTSANTSFTSRILNKSERRLVHVLTEEQSLLELDTPPGFMLTGPPGTGKSMLLDMFYEALPTPRKIRRHYEQVLLHIYHQSFQYLEAQRITADATSPSPWSRREEMKAKALSEGWMSVFAGGRSLSDPDVQKEYVLAQLAAQLIQQQGWLLAFDEFQMVDVAGASLLRSVLEWYFRLGGVVVGTSNRLPDDLYQHGVQRQQFLSFITLIQSRCPIIELDSSVDYRRTFLTRQALQNIPDADDAPQQQEHQEQAWYLAPHRDNYLSAVDRLTQGHKAEAIELPVYGRKVKVPQAFGRQIARFTFDQLCRAELGPADYLTLASQFHTIILDDVPYLPVAAKNEARRFISLIDALYETKTRLLCSSADEIDNIFFPDAAEVERQASAEEADSLTEEAISELYNAPYRPNISSYEEQDSSQSTSASDGQMPSERRSVSLADERHPSSLSSIPAFRSLAIFSGQDERFAFRRAVSRLHEISAPYYWAKARHTPLPESWRSWERAFNPTASATHHKRPLRSTWSPAEQAEPDAPTYDLSPDKIRVKFAEGSPAYRHEQQQAKRSKPPRIGSHHIWGVMESWGARAGRWGKGASVYEKNKDN